MENFNRKIHWDNIYQTKALEEVSWFQPNPETSLNFIKQFDIPKSANIIDVGGGDGFFVDHLLELGYQNISVLDISAVAIERAKKRLGNKAKYVKWIVEDVSKFIPTEQYDFWHDRAAFHFLIQEEDISKYLIMANTSIKPTGIMVIGTFSEEGPLKCSGIEIKQYSALKLTERFNLFFEKMSCIAVQHKTPFNTIQSFTFCSFKKLGFVSL